MNLKKNHPRAPLRNHSFIKTFMIRLAQITFVKKYPYLIKHINQTDEKEYLFPEDTAYAINF